METKWRCFPRWRGDEKMKPTPTKMNHLIRSPISVDSLLREVQNPERGGTCVFLGTVRSDDEVTAIEYSAYDDMAVAEIERMLAEAVERWPNARVTLQHRLGLIPVGEASIGI